MSLNSWRFEISKHITVATPYKQRNLRDSDNVLGAY